MATRQSVEELIKKADITLAQAEDQLKLTNRNGFEIDSEYSEAQRQLAEVEVEIQNMMNSANHQQRDQLQRLHFKVTNYLNDMVLDQVDINQFE